MTKYINFRDGGKTDEQGISRPFGKLFAGEVLEGFAVSQQSPLAMGVSVSTGDIMIASGNGYPYLGWSDAVENITITTADGSNPRYDLIVAYVDKAVVSTASSNNPGALKIIKVTGTPSGTPTEPNGTAIQSAVGIGNPYAILARVTVGAGVTTITNASISDRRTLVSNNTSGASSDWSTVLTTPTVSTGYNKGAREYDITYSGTDLTPTIPIGSRYKVDRTGAVPTQCTDLEKDSSQYASKSSPTGIIFTDDFTCEAWIKLESYTGAEQAIISRFNGSNGFLYSLSIAGQLSIAGFAASARGFSTYQSIPLNQWVHVASTLDMSAGTATHYINGVLAPSYSTLASATSLIQAGNLQIGATNGASYLFDGQISDVRLWNTVRSATQIRDNMNQQLIGNETNLVGYWKLNGNFNDSTSNANNMSGVNGAVATSNDNPMKSTEYGLVTKVSYSGSNTTITVFTGTDYNIPNISLTGSSFSTVRTPSGFPASSGKWRVTIPLLAGYTKSVGSATTYYVSPCKITVPIGAWKLGYEAGFRAGGNSPAAAAHGQLLLTEQSSDFTTTSTILTSESDLMSTIYTYTNNATLQVSMSVSRSKFIEKTSQSVYSFAGRTAEGGGSYEWSIIPYSTNFVTSVIYADCAYI